MCNAYSRVPYEIGRVTVLDMDLLSSIVSLLEPFYTAICDLESQSIATLHMVIHWVVKPK